MREYEREVKAWVENHYVPTSMLGEDGFGTDWGLADEESSDEDSDNNSDGEVGLGLGGNGIGGAGGADGSGNKTGRLIQLRWDCETGRVVEVDDDL